MEDRREKLQGLLEDFLGSRNVYYQPPTNLKMKYPCIRYKSQSGYHRYASNTIYAYIPEYEITYIHQNPVDPKVDEFLHKFRYIRKIRHYESDGLIHDVYSIYY